MLREVLTPYIFFLPRYWNTFLPLWLIECNIAALTNMIFEICSCRILDINNNIIFRISSCCRYLIGSSACISNIIVVCHFIKQNFDFFDAKLWYWLCRENKWRLWWCIGQCHNFFFEKLSKQKFMCMKFWHMKAETESCQPQVLLHLLISI